MFVLVIVDCTGNGLPRKEPLPVFDGSRMTLQSVAVCQQVFSAALIAHVESRSVAEDEKNVLCTPIPLCSSLADLQNGDRQIRKNIENWYRTFPNWMRDCRLFLQGWLGDDTHEERQAWYQQDNEKRMRAALHGDLARVASSTPRGSQSSQQILEPNWL